jgi:hypothetical protein
MKRPHPLAAALNFIAALALMLAPVTSGLAQRAPVEAKSGMVASVHDLASEVGVEILKKGGNAADAGAAVGLALTVVYPFAGNIGGGGFMMIHLFPSLQSVGPWIAAATYIAVLCLFLLFRFLAGHWKDIKVVKD